MESTPSLPRMMSRIRRLLADAFSEKAPHEQKPLLQQYVDLLIASVRVRAIAGESIDISDWLNFTTFDIIGDLSYGEWFNCLRCAVYHFWVTILFDTFKASALIHSTILFFYRAWLEFSNGPSPRNPSRTLSTILTSPKPKCTTVSRWARLGQISWLGSFDMMETWACQSTRLRRHLRCLLLPVRKRRPLPCRGIFSHLAKNRDVLKRVTEKVRTSFDSEEHIWQSRI